MGKINFKFIGANKTCNCGINTPHIPHILGNYNTVHYGKLYKFCEGIEGNGIKIVITENLKGDGGSAARLIGNYTSFNSL